MASSSRLPPPYSTSDDGSMLHVPDTRSSSSLSLVPTVSLSDPRRKLLLIYLHGFMGSEASFQQFPAHVHNMVSAVLSESHIVHTKIYPRYRTKQSIQNAANDLSEWLSPHESTTTDVILLAHSLGGIVTADLVLLTQHSYGPLRHRILGTINFDTPFLGLHPGIIKAGLGSLFRSESMAEDDEPSAADDNFNPAFFNDRLLTARSGWRNAAHFVNKHSENLRDATKQLLTSHFEFGSCLKDVEGLRLRYCQLRMLEEDDPTRRKSILRCEVEPPRVRFANYYTASTGRPKATSLPPQDQSLDEKPPVSVDEDAESVLSELDNFTLADVDSNFDDASDAAPEYTDHAQPYPAEKSQPARYSAVIREAPAVQAVRRAFDDEQASMPPEPEPVGPPPLRSQFTDPEEYRAELSEHGRASQAYFEEAREHQKSQYSRFVQESKAKSEAWSTQIAELHVLLAAEAKRLAEGIAENARIVAEIQREQQVSHVEHRKLVQEFNKNKAPVVEKTPTLERLSSTEVFDKARRKISERQLKIDRKLQKHREKLEKDRLKIEKKLGVIGMIPSLSVPLVPASLLSTRDAEANLSFESNSVARATPALPQETGVTEVLAQDTSQTLDRASKSRVFCNLPPPDQAGLVDPTWICVFMDKMDEVAAHTHLFSRKNAFEAAQAQWSERYTKFVCDVSELVEKWVGEEMSRRFAQDFAEG